MLPVSQRAFLPGIVRALLPVTRCLQKQPTAPRFSPCPAEKDTRRKIQARLRVTMFCRLQHRTAGRAATCKTSPQGAVPHRMSLDEAPEGYTTFMRKQDDCIKVVLRP